MALLRGLCLPSGIALLIPLARGRLLGRCGLALGGRVGLRCRLLRLLGGRLRVALTATGKQHASQCQGERYLETMRSFHVTR